MATQRPRPRIDADNRAFWTGGAAGQLQIMQCGDCSTYLHPPRSICRVCQSENVVPQVVAGTGTIDTFTVNHQPWLPGLEVPFVIARVRLDDVPGVFLTTNIVGSPVDEIDVDDRVQVVFEEQAGVHYPLFEKVVR